MKKRAMCFLICLLLIATLISVSGQRTQHNFIQNCDEKHPSATGRTWMKTLGGKNYDNGGAIQQTSDGGYIIAGSTENFGMGGTDVWLIKTDENGDELWNTTFGTTNGTGEFEIGTSVIQTSDNGYLITARINSNDFWLIRTDENGNEVWIKEYLRTEAFSMCQTDDECYVICGYHFMNFTSSGLWILKVDTSGNEIWQKTFSEIKSYGLSIKQTSDHGYIVGGYSCIVKIDKNGEENWNITLRNDMECRDVLQSNDGNYASIGWKGVWGRNNSGWLMRIDPNGNLLSLKKYGGVFTGYILTRFHQTSDGGYIITGEEDNLKPLGPLQLKLCIIKTNENGNIIWKRTYGSGIDWDFGIDIQELSDGGYIVLGGTNSYGAGSVDIWLIKTDSHGQVQFVYRFLNLFQILKNVIIMISRMMWISD